MDSMICRTASVLRKTIYHFKCMIQRTGNNPTQFNKAKRLKIKKGENSFDSLLLLPVLCSVEGDLYVHTDSHDNDSTLAADSLCGLCRIDRGRVQSKEDEGEREP